MSRHPGKSSTNRPDRTNRTATPNTMKRWLLILPVICLYLIPVYHLLGDSRVLFWQLYYTVVNNLFIVSMVLVWLYLPKTVGVKYFFKWGIVPYIGLRTICTSFNFLGLFLLPKYVWVIAYIFITIIGLKALTHQEPYMYKN